MDKLKVLERPIEPHEIEWRIQSSRNGKTTIVPYITNRCVMDRFDEQFGWNGWESFFKETSTGYLCELRVTYDGNMIVKSDGASKTKIEPDKGGISDAMKRAAVQFGLGRSLYKYPLTQIEGETKYIPNDIKRRLGNMVEAINSGKFKDSYVIFKNK